MQISESLQDVQANSRSTLQQYMIWAAFLMLLCCLHLLGSSAHKRLVSVSVVAHISAPAPDMLGCVSYACQKL